MEILNSWAGHAQTQGVIERGNRTLEVALGKWMLHSKTHKWSKGKRTSICLLDLIMSDVLLNV